MKNETIPQYKDMRTTTEQYLNMFDTNKNKRLRK